MHNKFCQCRMNSKALHIEPRSRLSELANVIGDHAHGFATRLLLMVTRRSTFGRIDLRLRRVRRVVHPSNLDSQGPVF